MTHILFGIFIYIMIAISSFASNNSAVIESEFGDLKFKNLSRHSHSSLSVGWNRNTSLDNIYGWSNTLLLGVVQISDGDNSRDSSPLFGYKTEPWFKFKKKSSYRLAPTFSLQYMQSLDSDQFSNSTQLQYGYGGQVFLDFAETEFLRSVSLYLTKFSGNELESSMSAGLSFRFQLESIKPVKDFPAIHVGQGDTNSQILMLKIRHSSFTFKKTIVEISDKQKNELVIISNFLEKYKNLWTKVRINHLTTIESEADFRAERLKAINDVMSGIISKYNFVDGKNYVVKNSFLRKNPSGIEFEIFTEITKDNFMNLYRNFKKRWKAKKNPAVNAPEIGNREYNDVE